MHCFSLCKKSNGRNWLCVGLTLSCIDWHNFKEVPVDFNRITREDISVIVLACWKDGVFLFNLLCTTSQLPSVSLLSAQPSPFPSYSLVQMRIVHFELHCTCHGDFIVKLQWTILDNGTCVHNRPLTVSIWVNCQFRKALSLSLLDKERKHIITFVLIQFSRLLVILFLSTIIKVKWLHKLSHVQNLVLDLYPYGSRRRNICPCGSRTGPLGVLWKTSGAADQCQDTSKNLAPFDAWSHCLYPPSNVPPARGGCQCAR